jgi:hypothetical protein
MRVHQDLCAFVRFDACLGELHRVARDFDPATTGALVDDRLVGLGAVGEQERRECWVEFGDSAQPDLEGVQDLALSAGELLPTGNPKEYHHAA